jgi:hypothetical protein
MAGSVLRASSAVGLLLVSSMAIFGVPSIHGSGRSTLPAVEPVWVNGIMGVWDPDNGDFVPSTSPNFNSTCERIQRKRDQANGQYYSGGTYSSYHRWYLEPGSNLFTYSDSSTARLRAAGGSFSGHSGSSIGSSRGGFGATGAAHGGHGGGE